MTTCPIHQRLGNLTTTERSKIRRAPKRASYSREDTYGLIDRLKTGHLAFIEDGEPRSIPITVWRLGDVVYFHFLQGGRLSRRLPECETVCISFAETTEWVMSKSAFHHSANYQSAVIYGRPQRITDPQQFDLAFAAIIDQLEPGRWEQVRPPSPKERKATALFALPLEEGAYKSRSGGPNEEPEDMLRPVWHGTKDRQGHRQPVES